MTFPRLYVGIMQCALALLLLVGGSSLSGAATERAALLVLAEAAEAVVTDAQPHQGAYKRETGRTVADTRRHHEPTPKALAPAQSAEPVQEALVLADACTAPSVWVNRHRSCSAPPTGPPLS